MSGLVNVMVIVAVVALVIVRQFRTQRVTGDRKLLLVPAVLTVPALREPSLLDPHHHTASAALLAAELLIGLVTGAGWAWTTRIWTEADGSVWSRSTKAGALIWLLGIALRAGLYAVGAAVGVTQGTAALLLALAATLLVRSGILVWRAQSQLPAAHSTAAYGDGMRRPSWKEGV